MFRDSRSYSVGTDIPWHIIGQEWLYCHGILCQFQYYYCMYLYVKVLNMLNSIYLCACSVRYAYDLSVPIQSTEDKNNPQKMHHLQHYHDAGI